jgi:hypothetical protein
MPVMPPDPADAAENLAAVSLVRAAVVNDRDRGMLIINQHGGNTSRQTAVFVIALAHTAARMMLSASGYNLERTLETLDAWADEYATRAQAAP